MIVLKHKFKFIVWSHQQTINGKRKRGSCKSWLLKWDRTIAGLTALVIFTAMLGLVIYNTTKYQSRSSNHNSTQTRQTQLMATTKCLKNSQPEKACQLTCDGFSDLPTLTSAINDVDLKKCSKNFLVLTKMKFPEDRMDVGWLEGVIWTIHTLQITDSDLADMGERAFSGVPFQSLETITLAQVKLSYLRKSAFFDATITTVQITNVQPPALDVEENVFEGISHRLTVLQLQDCLSSATALPNISGPNVNSLPSLQTLDLSANNLAKLSSDSFTNAPNLVLLNLQHSGISEIEANIFATNSKLQLLYLNDNILRTLPQGIFDSLKNGLITIGDNLWNCNCDLLWFRDFYKNKEELFADEFCCETNADCIDYEEVDFCPDNSSTTTSTTSSSTTSTVTTTMESSTITGPQSSSSTSLPISLVDVLCMNEDSEISTPEDVDPYIVHIRNQTVEMRFYQIEDSSNYIVDITGAVKTDDSLLWMDCSNKGNLGCCGRLLNNPKEISLRYEETFTFCLLQKTESAVSPFDCAALTVPPEWRNRTWLPNNLRTVIISAICGIIVTVALLSSLIMFYCIRQHPNLIKGNKRVIIVESKAADAIVMPKAYDQLNYQPPSLNSYSDGYLTPKNKTYQAIGRSAVLGTISENCESTVMTSRLSPSHRMRKSQVKKRARLEHVAQAFDEHVYEPPPLPPNHPSEWRSNMTDGYSRV